MTDTPQLLSAAQTAKYLGRDVRAVRRWIADGVLPSLSIDGRAYVALPQLERWLASAHDRQTPRRARPGLRAVPGGELTYAQRTLGVGR